MHIKAPTLLLAGLALSCACARAGAPDQAAPLPATELSQVVQAALGELDALDAFTSAEPNINKRLEAYEQFSYSDALKPRLQAVFRSEKPLALVRQSDAGGRRHYLGALEFNHFANEQTSVAWNDMTVKADTNHAGNYINYSVNVPSVMFATNGGGFLNNFQLNVRQARAADQQWYGELGARVKSFSLRDLEPDGLLLTGIKIDAQTQPRGDSADVRYAMSFDSVNLDGRRMEDVNLAVRMQGVDRHSLAALNKVIQAPPYALLPPDFALTTIWRKIKELGQAILRHGGRLDIDDISGKFLDELVSLKGHISVAPMAQGDPVSLRTVLGKLTGKLEVRVPVVMLEEYTRIIAAPGQDAASPESLEQRVMARHIRESIGAGYVRLEDKALHSVIEIKDGALTLNGKAAAFGAIKNGRLP